MDGTWASNSSYSEINRSIAVFYLFERPVHQTLKNNGKTGEKVQKEGCNEGGERIRCAAPNSGQSWFCRLFHFNSLRNRLLYSHG